MEQPIYKNEDAAQVIWEQLPLSLQLKFTEIDIADILETNFEYIADAQENSTGTFTWTVEKASSYIISRELECGRIVSFEDLCEIFSAEYHYLLKIGIVREFGEN